MINTKIYKAVYGLSEKLMDAANKDNKEAFAALYAQLLSICIENEQTDKDHPEQWETLADFTEDLEQAVLGYEKALAKAEKINSKDHLSSIGLSMATLLIELGQTDKAINVLQHAQVNANKIVDKDLKLEIDTLLEDVSRA